MLKDILNLNGVEKLDKQQKKDISGGAGGLGPILQNCAYDNYSAALYGCPVQPNSPVLQQPTCYYVCVPGGRWVRQ